MNKTKIHILAQRFSELFRTILRNNINVSHLNKTELNNIFPSNPEHFMSIKDMYFGAEVQLEIEINNPQEVQKFLVNALSFYVEV